MKRIVICCDGTWQSLDSAYPTNVVKIAQSVKSRDANGVLQVVYYSSGVGTSNGTDRITGGAFGWGLDREIAEAYRFLSLNWEPGDEIYLVGFSRGAYTVRSLAGLLRNCSLVRRQHLRQVPVAIRLYRDRQNSPNDDESVNFRRHYAPDDIEVTALCCFDTVGALGVPDLIPFFPFNDMVNSKYTFHDTQLSRIIRHAFHACAVDERRKPFDLAPMEKSPHRADQVLRQIWFPGDHGCIGGGSAEKVSLSNIALNWMMGQMTGLGLGFDPTVIPGGTGEDPLAPWRAEGGFMDIAGKIDRTIHGGARCLHASVRRRWQSPGCRYRPANLRPFSRTLNA